MVHYLPGQLYKMADKAEETSSSRPRFQIALRQLRPEMQTSLVVRNIIARCHTDAGGFLSTMEEDFIMSRSPESERVYDLIGILISKDDVNAFKTFCSILARCNHGALAYKLMEKAGECYHRPSIPIEGLWCY